MEEVVVDKAGRMVLPKKVRDEFDTKVFEVTVEKKKIILKPKKGLADLFGSLPDLDTKAFYRWKKEEAKRETIS